MQESNYKLVLVGEASVGKTSLISQFVSKTFSTVLSNTVGGIHTSRLLYLGSHAIRFNIWDTAGQERYRSLVRTFYKDAQAAILVYDITDKASFEAMKRWADELRENGSDHIGSS